VRVAEVVNGDRTRWFCKRPRRRRCCITLEHYEVLHERMVLLAVVNLDVPEVLLGERVAVQRSAPSTDCASTELGMPIEL
jgi:hypothetical protein